MLLKQCQPRIKALAANRLERWGDSSFVDHSRLPLPAARALRNLTAVTSRGVRFTSTAAPVGTCPWRRRRPSVRLPAPARELSSTVQRFQYDVQQNISCSDGGRRFFDTHAVVRLFEENAVDFCFSLVKYSPQGFTTQQAEVLVKILVQMTNSNMEVIYNDMVTKVQQEIMLQQVMSQIAAVKKDMIILEKSEFSTLLAENEKLKLQLFQLSVQLADVMEKVRSDSLLDMNLEKSRVKEL